jgi:hypothetical protein
MRTVRVEIDGVVREGRFRVMGGSVIVYFEDKIKYALYGLDRPETVARWLLSRCTRDWTPIGAVTLNPERESVVTMASHATLKQPLAA